MPTKLNRIRELGRQLTLSRQSQGEVQQLDHLRTLSNEMQGPVEGFERQSARCRVLGLDSDAAGLRKLSERLSTLRIQLTQDPAQVGQGRIFSAFKDTLVEMNKKLREDADAEWGRLRKEALQSAPRGILSFWETIPELREDAEEVRRHLSYVEGRDRPVQEPNQLKTFVEACVDVRVRTERLNAFEAPPAVRGFLQAARSGSGASWAELTDDVRSWLGDHGLLESLRLTLD